MWTAVRCYTTVFSNSRTAFSTLKNNYTSKCSLGLTPNEGGKKWRKQNQIKTGSFIFCRFLKKFQFIDMIITIEVTAEFHYFRSGEWKFIGLFMLKLRVICSKYPGGKKIALCLWGVIIVFTVSTINPMQDITDNWKQKLNILSLLV